MSNSGLIYLVQPSEYIGSNVYKIGYSLQENFIRLLSYRKIRIEFIPKYKIYM